MKIGKKVLALFVTFTLIASTVPSAFAAENSYSDVPSDHWANDVIAKWSSDAYGVLQGNSDGTFAPSRGLTLGELATILSKTFGYTERTPAEVSPAWADEYIEKAVAARIIAKADSIDASVAVTREQAVKYIALAYNVAPAPGNTAFADDASIDAEYKPYVNAFQKLGYVAGKGGGVFDPKAVYTRAEAMQVIENTTAEIVDNSVSGQTYAKNLVVRKSGVTVKDTTVNSNFIVGQGVGDGEVTLENVSIGGSLIAYGGGANSITVKGDDAIASVVVDKPYGEAVHISGNFGTITVTDGTKLILTGKAASLILLGNSESTLNGAAVDSTEANGAGAKLNVTGGSTVENVTVGANSVVISGSGAVKTVDVTANAKEGVEVLTVPTEVTVDENAGAVNTKNGTVQPGKTATTANSSSGGGGYSSSGSTGPTSSKNLLSIQAGIGGSVTAGTSEQYEKGSVVTITATANAGYEFSEWISSAGGTFADSSSTTTTFTMPANAVAVTAMFTAVSNTATTLQAMVSEDEFTTGTSVQLYVYAEFNGTASDVQLLDEDGSTVLAALYDDGQYSVSGDDLQNDNIYSCVIDLDTAAEARHTYYVRGAGDTALMSDEINIDVIAPLTEAELSDIQTVNDSLATLKDADYLNLDISGKEDALVNSLDTLVAEGLIAENSILYDDISKSYSFTYSSGVLGGTAVIPEDDPEYFGDNESPKLLDIETMVALQATVGSISNENIGKGLLLQCADTTSNWSTSDFTNLRNSWSSNGLETEFVSNGTLDDLCELSDYSFVCITAHGNYMQWKYVDHWIFGYEAVTTSVFKLKQKSNASTDKKYSADLKERRIGIYDGVYIVLPDFFNAHYKYGDLSNTFIYFAVCQLFGEDDTTDDEEVTGGINEAWTYPLNNAAIKAFVGFYDQVEQSYAKILVTSIVADLLKGMTIQEALDDSLKKHGGTREEDIGSGIQGIYRNPVLRGGKNAKLINTDFKNGGFEQTPILTGWNKTGDVRVISQLGAVTPQAGNKMALLTTGIGSQESEYLGATEGSVLSQTFIVPSDAASLSLKYDVVSEEPMEFVGSQFDDKLIIQIVTGSGTTDIAKEEVNTSVWLPITGINFEGGDSTVYHTGWKSVTADLSAYKGKSITIKIVVYDVGDSIYDTAAVIDDITIQ
jgi:hypothetical protein